SVRPITQLGDSFIINVKANHVACLAELNRKRQAYVAETNHGDRRAIPLGSFCHEILLSIIVAKPSYEFLYTNTDISLGPKSGQPLQQRGVRPSSWNIPYLHWHIIAYGLHSELCLDG